MDNREKAKKELEKILKSIGKLNKLGFSYTLTVNTINDEYIFNDDIFTAIKNQLDVLNMIP